MSCILFAFSCECANLRTPYVISKGWSFRSNVLCKYALISDGWFVSYTHANQRFSMLIVFFYSIYIFLGKLSFLFDIYFSQFYEGYHTRGLHIHRNLERGFFPELLNSKSISIDGRIWSQALDQSMLPKVCYHPYSLVTRSNLDTKFFLNFLTAPFYV